MTADEFARLMKMVMAAWPAADVDEETLKFYGMELLGLEFDAAAAAVRAINREADPFLKVPTAGMIRLKVIELVVDPPPWADVLRVGRRLVDAGIGGPYGRFDSVRRRVAAILEDCHPLARAFIDEVGTAQVRAHLDDGGGGEARFRTKWETFLADRLRSYALSDLPAPDSFQRVERARQTADGDLRQLGMASVVAELQPGSE